MLSLLLLLSPTVANVTFQCFPSSYACSLAIPPSQYFFHLSFSMSHNCVLFTNAHNQHLFMLTAMIFTNSQLNNRMKQQKNANNCRMECVSRYITVPHRNNKFYGMIVLLAYNYTPFHSHSIVYNTFHTHN